MKNITMETGSGISWGGAGISFLGFVNDIEWVTLIGLVVAIGGFVMNFYFSYQREAREKEEHNLKKQVYLSQIKNVASKDEQ